MSISLIKFVESRPCLIHAHVCAQRRRQSESQEATPQSARTIKPRLRKPRGRVAMRGKEEEKATGA